MEVAERAKEALLGVLMDPALRRQMEAEKKGLFAAFTSREMQSGVQGEGKKSNFDDLCEEVNVGKRTVDLDSDGDGEEFEVE